MPKRKAKQKRKSKRKGKSKMPANVVAYFKLRNSGMGKAAAKKKAGL